MVKALEPVSLMPHPKDITNQRFGKLTAKEPVSKYNRESIWRCLCDCGKVVDVRLGNLMSGNTRGCGCFRIEDMK